MSTATTHDHAASVTRSLLRAVSNVHVTTPATKKVRDRARADFRAVMGLNLSDDDRAAKVRAKHC